jgi:hypothetical protein
MQQKCVDVENEWKTECVYDSLYLLPIVLSCSNETFTFALTRLAINRTAELYCKQKATTITHCNV